jgi:hypothetical protein
VTPHDWLTGLRHIDGLRLVDAVALSHQNDPFNLRSATDLTQAEWFALRASVPPSAPRGRQVGATRRPRPGPRFKRASLRSLRPTSPGRAQTRSANCVSSSPWLPSGQARLPEEAQCRSRARSLLERT